MLQVNLEDAVIPHHGMKKVTPLGDLQMVQLATYTHVALYFPLSDSRI
jgi:hypothetical protein